MDEQLFQAKFAEVMQKIKHLPEEERSRLEQLAKETGDRISKIQHLPDTYRDRLQELAEQALERRAKMQSAISELQESLDYLRLSVKYLVFDLEATRRENAYLRKMIETTNRKPNQSRDDDRPNFLEDGEAG